MNEWEEVRVAADNFVDTLVRVAGKQVWAYAGWVLYVLEALDVELAARDFRRVASEVAQGIKVRLKEGMW